MDMCRRGLVAQGQRLAKERVSARFCARDGKGSNTWD